MSWLLIVGTAWVALSAPLALVFGRAVRLADHRESALSQLSVPDFLPEGWTDSPAGTSR